MTAPRATGHPAPVTRPLRPNRYLLLWAELLAVSWRRAPLLTAMQFVIPAGMAAAVVGGALALRVTVDAVIRGDAGSAVTGAAGAGLAGAAGIVLGALDSHTAGILIGKVAALDLGPRIHRDITTLDGLEHLERSDFQDRLTLVRNAGWEIVLSLWSANGVLFAVLELTVMLLLLGTVNPWLLWLLAFAAVPLWFDQRGNNAIIRADLAAAEPIRRQRHLFDLATDPAGGKDIRIAGAGTELANRQAAAWDEAMRLRLRAQLVAAGWRLAGWLLFTAGFGAALALVVHQATRGAGSGGDLVLAITVAAALRQSVYTGVRYTTNVASAGRVIDPYLWLRDYVRAQRNQAGATVPAPPRLRHGITLDRVGFRYPGATGPALADISVHLPAGSVVALVGEYGSGKTTLVKLLGKLYRPDTGRILVDGVPLDELETGIWRSRISATFQDFGRFPTRFAENVGVGDLPRLPDRERIAAAVREVDATGLVDRLPDGLDTELDAAFGGVDLSEGQWQKTALARAAMRPEPLLVLLDEPTASLDAPSEQEIFDRQMERSRRSAAGTNAVTVIVSHRFSTVTGADLILTLHRGRLVEAGSHRELMGIPDGRYAALYRIQAEAYDMRPPGD
ncbi:ABC transporter ATP-binding protein [Micromonospora sp. KC606]|uniref:ATP-binding cassette domain-containing protein n=1 Tax=Micromonospora sp. KC606 TaxID=2530379 RepID=UPI001047A4FD|nr:ABC transporter ATP-binding protein [Micromonospora sp. KC606]TDC84551.1 ABC transporter ATP-binding protein [Micromonospora sp. KC606]